MILDEGENLSEYVVGMSFFAIAPIIFAVLSFPIFRLLKMKNPQKYGTNYIRNFIATNITFIFLIYPTITSYTFGMFNCTEVEGISYLTTDLSYECWSSDHISLLLKYTLPALLIWVIGFPVFIFFVLYRHRFDLSSKDVIAKYG